MRPRSRGPFGSELWAGRVARLSKRRGERGGRAVSAARRPRAEEVRAGTGPAADRAEPAAAPRAAAPWSLASRFGSGRALSADARNPPLFQRGTGEAVRKPDDAPWARASHRERGP